MMPRVLWAVLPVACAGLGCGSGGETGTVQVTAYAEEFVEQGIAAEEMADGWSVAFERFSVSVANVSLAGLPVEVVSTIELAQPSGGSGQVLGEVATPEGRYQDARYDVLQTRVAGTATRAGEAKSFDWSFEEPVRHSQCATVTAVRAGEVSTLQITLHADHLFYDSLVAEEPALRFQSLANADENEDGVVQLDELALASLGTYDPGNADEVQDLRGWLRAAARSMGHIDGEGHCEVARLGAATTP